MLFLWWLLGFTLGLQALQEAGDFVGVSLGLHPLPAVRMPVVVVLVVACVIVRQDGAGAGAEAGAERQSKTG